MVLRIFLLSYLKPMRTRKVQQLYHRTCRIIDQMTTTSRAFMQKLTRWRCPKPLVQSFYFWMRRTICHSDDHVYSAVMCCSCCSDSHCCCGLICVPTPMIPLDEISVTEYKWNLPLLPTNIYSIFGVAYSCLFSCVL